jgi:arginyl-tRNA--protein-N-Asp/Glu arginylyltransferase
MAHLLRTSIEAPRPCPYLAGPLASLEHRVMLDVSAEEADDLLDRGWRHFGPGWFRPACRACQACVSTRIVVEDFVPSGSQRRAYRGARRLRAEIGEPRVDDARIALFHAWHGNRVEVRGWEPAPLDREDYFMQFAFPTAVAREVAYYDDASAGALAMVAICDETPTAWNAVFCFWDPRLARVSPGIVNILNLVDLARARGQRHVHLGYRVSGCPSLGYKAAFHAQEVLTGLPADDEAPRWQRASVTAGAKGDAGSRGRS